MVIWVNNIDLDLYRNVRESFRPRNKDDNKLLDFCLSIVLGLQVFRAPSVVDHPLLLCNVLVPQNDVISGLARFDRQGNKVQDHHARCNKMGIGVLVNMAVNSALSWAGPCLCWPGVHVRGRGLDCLPSKEELQLFPSSR